MYIPRTIFTVSIIVAINTKLGLQIQVRKQMKSQSYITKNLCTVLFTLNRIQEMHRIRSIFRRKTYHLSRTVSCCCIFYDILKYCCIIICPSTISIFHWIPCRHFNHCTKSILSSITMVCIISPRMIYQQIDRS